MTENKNKNSVEEFTSEELEDLDEDLVEEGEDYEAAEDEEDAEEEDSRAEENSAVAKDADRSITIAKTKATLMKKLLENTKNNIEQLARMMADVLPSEEEVRISIGQAGDEKMGAGEEDENVSKIIEGIFDGEKMIGPDGKEYSVPANYASKSKLVEGDIMKLTIAAGGAFIYKQIGPIERTRVTGALEKEDDGIYYVAADGKRWRVLTASVTYFKGEPGDEAVIVVPKTGESKWAAMENIIQNKK